MSIEQVVNNVVDPATGEEKETTTVQGHVRIRAKTQGIALSLGDRITVAQKGGRGGSGGQGGAAGGLEDEDEEDDDDVADEIDGVGGAAKQDLLL